MPLIPFSFSVNFEYPVGEGATYFENPDNYACIAKRNRYTNIHAVQTVLYNMSFFVPFSYGCFLIEKHGKPIPVKDKLIG